MNLKETAIGIELGSTRIKVKIMKFWHRETTSGRTVS